MGRHRWQIATRNHTVIFSWLGDVLQAPWKTILGRVKMGEDSVAKVTKTEKQKRTFGTLKWSQWSQKKCSEQLRSSSIDGSCQMVRTGTRKTKKWSTCFWILGLKYWRVIVDRWFCYVFESAEALKVSKSGPQNSFLVKFWSKTFFLDFYHFVFCFFLHIHFFIFWHFRNSMKNNFLWRFPLFLFNFAPKILPEPPL